MDFINRLKRTIRGLAPERIIFKSPSDLYKHPISALIAAIVKHHETSADSAGWIDIRAKEHGSKREFNLQISGRVLNLLQEDIPLPQLLIEEGMNVLADHAVRKDVGLFELRDATPEELAIAADIVLKRHYGLPDEYEVEAELDG
ncbi:MAG: hypothetical protein IT435_00840 [Phycisphaerales bacterium]|nr:hypothetical protein [Phycisphaerales bacterium]